MRGTHNKLGEGERKVRLGQDSLPNSYFHRGNEQKVGTLFYPDPEYTLHIFKYVLRQALETLRYHILLSIMCIRV